MTARFDLALAAALALGLATTPAVAGTRSQEQALAAARPDGPPVDCVQLRQIRESRVRSDSVIDFYMLGNKVYRNTLPNSCPRLGFEQAFSYRTSISQLCSVDIITVISRGTPGIAGPSCGLGKFQPVTGLKR